MTRYKIIQQAGCRTGAEEKPLEPQGSKQERGAQGAGGAWLKQERGAQGAGGAWLKQERGLRG